MLLNKLQSNSSIKVNFSSKGSNRCGTLYNTTFSMFLILNLVIYSGHHGRDIFMFVVSTKYFTQCIYIPRSIFHMPVTYIP
jgi:hypothetical protein